MPTNLNALIRYKQIDNCLRNRFVDCTIQRMQEVCSEALAEYQGVYKTISERTIRNDIRVMRSEMLGFNAPIVFENGRYFYSDPDYSIFQMTINEMDLLREVWQMLIKEKDKLSGPEVDTLLQRIAEITGDELKPEEEIKVSERMKHGIAFKSRINKHEVHYSLPPDSKASKGMLEKALSNLSHQREQNTVYWGYIMELL